jgi:hypothetical protein
MIKQIIYIVLFLLIAGRVELMAQIAVSADGSDPAPSAQLEVKSTQKGVLIPRMTVTQRNLISNPESGLMIFNTDCGHIQFFNGITWTTLNGTVIPGRIQSIDGMEHPCLSYPVTFSVNPVSSQSIYHWEVSQGISILQGQGTPQVVVNISETSGTICVTEISDCESSAPFCRTFTTAPPPELPVISIVVSSNPVCENMPVTFIAESTGAPFQYEWIVNGSTWELSELPVFSYMPQTGDVVICMAHFNLDCFGPYSAETDPVVMMVNPVTTVGLTITSDVTQVCKGRVVSFTASPVNGGTLPQFQWKVNGNAVSGATNTNYTYAPQFGDAVTCSMVTSWTCPSVNPVISNSIAMQVDTAMLINHVVGNGVAPVTKTVYYGLTSNIPGEASKCWITQNLGSDRQALNESDDTELSAGWYWQFNQSQGNKHDGISVTPAWSITSISENTNWQAMNDPCKLELGVNWRIPTYSEWYNVDNAGGWNSIYDPWNSGLKLHAAGMLNRLDGSLSGRGGSGYYWSTGQNSSTTGFALTIIFSGCWIESASYNKATGFTVRCIKP